MTENFFEGKMLITTKKNFLNGGIVMIERFFLKIFMLALLINILMVVPVQAEIKVYTGIGEHYMEDANETLDESQVKAKIAAELNALEQAQFYVQGYSEMHESNLTQDEIITITAGILNIIDVKYSLADDAGILLMKAEVTAEMDTDKIEELVELEVKRRTNKR